jgi:hypothetical protein
MSPAGPAPTMATCVRTPQNGNGRVPLWTRGICMQTLYLAGPTRAVLESGGTMLYTSRDDGQRRLRSDEALGPVAVRRLVAGLTEGGTS